MDGIVADLVALLGALRITGPVHLAGCAMGAAAALAFAGRHPARVGRIVAASPATWANADPAAARKRIEETERGGVRAVESGSLAASYPEVVRALDRARFERFRRRWLGNDPEAMAAMAAKVAAQIPGARYVEASSGHFMAIETPDLFNELAIPFLTTGSAGVR